jgi:hypothetical protein
MNKPASEKVLHVTDTLDRLQFGQKPPAQLGWKNSLPTFLKKQITPVLLPGISHAYYKSPIK